jgi:hypothetical protein
MNTYPDLYARQLSMMCDTCTLYLIFINKLPGEV